MTPPDMLRSIALFAFALATLLAATPARAQLPPAGLFSRTNLMAWCIVPFDAKKRGPEERAAMLQRLGIQRFAYDWRAEHIPTFDAEIAAMKQRGIEISAWWFPASLNAEARTILEALRRNRISPQLWVTMGTEPEPDPRKLGEKMAEALNILEPLCAAAAEVGSTVGLYNHLGWFGDPPNQVALIRRLKAAGHNNVGIVYNFHHAHDQIDRFADLLWLMRPHLLAVNLNGMIRGGDKAGKKIIPLGTGTEELAMLRSLRDSGWSGPIGLIGHTEDDAEWKLQQELDGLQALVPRLDSSAAPGRPAPGNPPTVASVPAPAPASTPAPLLPPPGDAIVKGRVGKALDTRVQQLLTAGTAEIRKAPLLVEAWIRLENAADFNVIAASESKASPTHWELYTYAGNGSLSFFSPGLTPSEIRSDARLADGRWHHVAAWIDTAEVVLFADGKEVSRTAVQRSVQPLPRGAQFAIGRLVEGGLNFQGYIESVRLGSERPTSPDWGRAALSADRSSIGIWTFETANDVDGWASLAATVPPQGPSQPIPKAETSPASKPTSVPAKATGVNRDEPWLQTEENWVDDRWNKTVQGRWQAYSIPSPAGVIRKGLAVHVGDPADAAVVYDTETGQWRMAWSGGFLRFDPARFGLINPPKPASDPVFALPESARWTGAPFRWNGFAVARDRIVVEYTLGKTAVRESPWSLPSIDGTLLIRDFEFGAGDQPLASLRLLESANAEFVEGNLAGARYFGFAQGNRVTLVALVPQPGAEIRSADRKSVELHIGARQGTTRVRLFYLVTDRSRIKQLEPAILIDGTPPNLAALIVSAHGPIAEPVVLKGQLGNATDAYAIDTISVPYENPWNALMFCSGVGFFDNGDAAVCTIHGDVWRVSRLDASLQRVTWRRIATGLYQPLGLTVTSNQVFVLARDHLTRLQDLDGDGTTDYYEAYSSLIDTSGGGHDYVTSLSRDKAGNFYYVDPKGAHRITPDGQSRQTVARGFRNPNGMGVHPDGTVITVAPQQGTWTPSSVIHELKQDGWYGYPGPKITADRPLGYDLPLCWIPHRIDNSSGSQIWAPQDRFGPLSGQLLHLSWGRCTMLLTLRDVVGDIAQGAVMPLKGRFLSGPTRGAFSPVDGQLYVVGCQGWQTAAARDGSFQRVRWTGKSLALPTGWSAHEGELRIRFNEPLDPETAQDPGSFSLEAWNYRYAEQYGSKDWSVSKPDQEGHDTWDVTAAKWEPSSKTVTLTVPALKPVMQFALKFNLDTSQRAPAAGELYGTIHRLHPK